MHEVEVTTTVKIPLSLEMMAKWFANLDDDTQARFFVEVAKEADTWKNAQCMQWFNLGSHLKNCECSTEGARNIIREIHNGLENGTH